MRKIENPRIVAKDVKPGTIVIPFIGDERFDVERVEVTSYGEVKFFNYFGDVVRMDADNRVEILGHFNP